MIKFECILLKKLLTSSEFFSRVYPIIKPKYFKDYGLEQVFKLASQYYTQYHEAPTEMTVATLIKDTVNLEVRQEIAKSLSTIHHEVTDVPETNFMIDETIKFVKDSIYYEALTIGAEGLSQKSDELKTKAQQLFDEMSKVTIDDNIGLAFSDIETMIQYYQERNIGILSQHSSLNKRLGTGFLPGTLSVIMAAQSVGKSLMMCDLISGMLLKGKNVLLVSLEMSDKEMMKRIHANVLGIDVNTFTDISKTDTEIQNLTRKATTKEEIVSAYNRVKDSVGKFYVKDYGAGTFSALMLENLVDKFRSQKDVVFDCIFVDYLGIMKSNLVSPNVGLYSYIKSIGEELRATAKKLQVPIISASQLNRTAINKTENVDNSAIADSIGTAATIDFGLMLLQNEDLKAQSEIVCKVTKNRFNGMTDSWIMGIDYPHMRFTELLEPGDPNTPFQTQNNVVSGLNKDFGIITPEKQSKAEQFAESEVRKVNAEVAETLKNDSTKNESEGSDYSEDIMKALGLN